jgi:nucleotide-binding universal stress UspA family protein
MYAKVLVPLDGSPLAERALNHAEEIGRATKAEVILFQSLDAPLGAAPEAGQVEETKALQEAAAAAGAYLEKTAKPLRDAGVKVRCEVAQGSADAQILGFAHREDVDLIIMSTHGRSGVSKLLLGSVAQKVMVTTKRPVLLVKPLRTHAERMEEADAIVSAH